MERWLTGTSVVFVWGAFNTVLAAILAWFTAAGTVRGAGPVRVAGPTGALAFSVYAASTTLVFLIGLAFWARRWRRQDLRVPPSPAAALLLAVGVAMAWIGLALGAWVTYLSAAPLLAALIFELYPRTRS